MVIIEVPTNKFEEILEKFPTKEEAMSVNGSTTCSTAGLEVRRSYGFGEFLFLEEVL